MDEELAIPHFNVIKGAIAYFFRIEIVHTYNTLFFVHTGAGNCLLNFIEQPITVDCLLYEEERIILKCTVSSEGLLNPDPLDPSRISIKWYFNNGIESELTVGTNETRKGGNGEHIVISSTLTITGSSFQHVAASLAQGSYYCRVNIANRSLVSNSSQQFIVLDEDSYLQAAARCSDATLITRERACAIVNCTSSETHATINYQNVTDVMIMQDIDATTFTQSTFDQNEGLSKVWIYILAAMLGAFLIIIVILIMFILILMIRKPHRNNVDRKFTRYEWMCIQFVRGSPIDNFINRSRVNSAQTQYIYHTRFPASLHESTVNFTYKKFMHVKM